MPSAERLRHADGGRRNRHTAAAPTPGTWPLERRVPFNVSVDLAYVGNKLVGGLPPAEGQTININNVQHIGGGDADRPYFIIVRPSARPRDLLAMAAGRRYHAMQVGVTRPFTQGLLLKGHYTLSRSKALRADYELPDAGKRRTATGRSPTAIGRTPSPMAFVYQLPWRSETESAAASRGSLINDWQLNGDLQRRSAARPSRSRPTAPTLNTPGNTADGRSRRSRCT